MTILYRWLSVCALLIPFASPALAEDLTPPPWARGAPLTTSASWDFLTDAAANFNFAPADGLSVPLIVGDAGNRGLPPYPVAVGFGMDWSDGQWFTNSPVNSGFSFFVPSWKGTYAVSQVRFQITYSGDPAPFMEWATSDYRPLSDDMFLSAATTDLGDGRFHRLEVWNIVPNPDRVSALLTLPLGAGLDQMIVDTRSFSTIAGDVNFDGVVDIFDVNLVSERWGQVGPVADANHDHLVNIFDINYLSAHWTGPGAAAVDEPSSWLLAGLAAVGVWSLRRAVDTRHSPAG